MKPKRVEIGQLWTHEREPGNVARVISIDSGGNVRFDRKLLSFSWWREETLIEGTITNFIYIPNKEEKVRKLLNKLL